MYWQERNLYATTPQGKVYAHKWAYHTMSDQCDVKPTVTFPAKALPLPTTSFAIPRRVGG